MIIPPQKSYLYYGNWSPEVDEAVLNTIINLKRATRWTLPDFPNWFLLTAQQEVRDKIDIQFTEAEIKQRLDFMKLRHETFNATLGEGASWDVGAAYVRANDGLWVTILQVWSVAFFCCVDQQTDQLHFFIKSHSQGPITIAMTRIS